jgi:hypothetical protein
MFAKAMQAGLKIDRAVVGKNRARIKPEARISVHKKEIGKSRLRVVRPTDPVHETVRFRADTPKRRHNNPPAGATVVSNTGRKVRAFKRA